MPLLFILLLQDKVYFYDFSTNQWQEVAPMQVGRFDHSCGLVRRSDGTEEVVVAGGYGKDSVEIFSLATEEWR